MKGIHTQPRPARHPTLSCLFSISLQGCEIEAIKARRRLQVAMAVNATAGGTLLSNDLAGEKPAGLGTSPSGGARTPSG